MYFYIHLYIIVSFFMFGSKASSLNCPDEGRFVEFYRDFANHLINGKNVGGGGGGNQKKKM